MFLNIIRLAHTIEQLNEDGETVSVDVPEHVMTACAVATDTAEDISRFKTILTGHPASLFRCQIHDDLEQSPVYIVSLDDEGEIVFDSPQ